MSKWEVNGMESKVKRVLTGISAAEHHFGRPYITAYQLAIALEEQNPGLCAALEKELGGKGTDEHHSLSEYVANQLSRRIKSEEISDMEGVFLKTRGIVSLQFTRGVISSNTDTVSLFRLKEKS